MRITKLLVFAVLSLLTASCSKIYLYELVKSESIKGIHPDSLRWRYQGGAISQIPVRDRDGKVYWLSVTPRTKLEVVTTENEQFRFYLQSIVVEDQGEGVLGATTSWRGYDTRQHANRSVMLREVRSMQILADEPASNPFVK